jgi:hypothetical protein
VDDLERELVGVQPLSLGLLQREQFLGAQVALVHSSLAPLWRRWGRSMCAHVFSPPSSEGSALRRHGLQQAMRLPAGLRHEVYALARVSARVESGDAACRADSVACELPAIEAMTGIPQLPSECQPEDATNSAH